MYGVIIIAHGSKESGAPVIIQELAKTVGCLLEDAHVECSFIRKYGGDFERIFDKFEALGISRIVVVPYFLFGGVHVVKTIPAIIEKQKEKYPKMEITVKMPLGIDKRLAEIVADRIME